MSYAAQIISIRCLELPPFDRCLSVVAFCQINLSRVSTPALSTLVISCRVVHSRVFSAPVGGTFLTGFACSTDRV